MLQEVEESPLQKLMNSPYFTVDKAMSLIRLGANPFTCNLQGDNLLHIAIRENRRTIWFFRPVYTHDPVIAALVKNYHLSLETPDGTGKKPLQKILDAGLEDWADRVMFLIRLGANPNVSNSQGVSLLQLLKNSLDKYASYILELTSYYHPRDKFYLDKKRIVAPFENYTRFSFSFFHRTHIDNAALLVREILLSAKTYAEVKALLEREHHSAREELNSRYGNDPLGNVWLQSGYYRAIQVAFQELTAITAELGNQERPSVG